jgi:hypothetical protein
MHCLPIDTNDIVISSARKRCKPIQTTTSAASQTAMEFWRRVKTIYNNVLRVKQSTVVYALDRVTSAAVKATSNRQYKASTTISKLSNYEVKVENALSANHRLRRPKAVIT